MLRAWGGSCNTASSLLCASVVAHSCFALVKKEWGIMPLVGSDPPCPGLAGATSEVEGQSCPVVCLMLRVPTVTRADTRDVRWLAVSWLVTENDYPSSCEY